MVSYILRHIWLNDRILIHSAAIEGWHHGGSWRRWCIWRRICSRCAVGSSSRAGMGKESIIVKSIIVKQYIVTRITGLQSSQRQNQDFISWGKILWKSIWKTFSYLQREKVLISKWSRSFIHWLNVQIKLSEKFWRYKVQYHLEIKLLRAHSRTPF